MDIKNLYNTFRKNAIELPTNLLLRIEEVFTNELKASDEIQVVDKITLEHIDPQKRNKKYQYDCNEQFKYTLGNYTLMGKNSNSSNSNKPWKDKKEILKNSGFRINTHHLCNYQIWNDDNVKNNIEWYIQKLKIFYNI
jgi:hypothetical protein